MSKLDFSELSLVSDPTIPTLQKACDPVVLQEYLPEALPSEWGAIRNVRVQVLRHRPGKGRCTFEVTLGTTRGCYSLIGKVYAADRLDVYQAMEEIRRAGFGSEDAFAIPRPVAFLAPLRLLLYEKVPGTRCLALILSPNESDRALAAERCARWLARFHAIAPRLGSVHAVGVAEVVCLKTVLATGRSYVRAELALQKAALCLEGAKRAVVKQTRERRERAEAMLDEGLRILSLDTN